MKTQDNNSKRGARFSERTELLLGSDGMKRLANSTVAVFGIGGVGSFTAEALARAGVGHIVLVDGDKVCTSNINRQLIATFDTLNQNKVEVARDRLLSINPNIKVEIHNQFFTLENADNFNMSSWDYIVDAVDMITAKILLIQKSKEFKVPIISCMGAANKLDPTKFKVADISQTSVCPLAKIIRRELKKLGITDVKTVFSTEVATKPEAVLNVNSNGDMPALKKRSPLGSVSFVPPVAGLIAAGEVVKDIVFI